MTIAKSASRRFDLLWDDRGTSPELMTLEKRLERFLGAHPRIHPRAYVAPEAVVVGDVEIEADASVWPMCVLRGDIERIVVGEGSNIQDGTVIHLADDLGVRIGRYVTVGHGAILHACTVADESLIGMRATVLDGATIGARSIVAAGAVVPKGLDVPPGSLVMGIPAKVSRELSEREQSDLKGWALKYITVASAHRARGESARIR